MHDGTCAVDDCPNPVKARGWCRKHYVRWQKHGDPNVTLRTPNDGGACAVDGCDGPSKTRGWCTKHYQRWRNQGDPEKSLVNRDPANPTVCSVADCEDRAVSRGWCGKHYQRWTANGDPEKVQRTVRPAHSPKDPCSVEACGRPATGRGWCAMHYTRWRLYGDPLTSALERIPRRDEDGATRRCTVEGCEGAMHTRGFCRTHYYRWSRYGDPLTVHRVTRRKRTPEEMAAGSKVCVVCRVRLPLDAFGLRKDSPDGRRYECRRCFTKKYNDRATQRAKTDPEYRERRAACRREYAAGRGADRVRETNRRNKLRVHYGMTVEDFDAMSQAQGGRCAICGALPYGGRDGARKKYLAVDHDHATGEVRALLCDGCNTGIGQFKEDPERIIAAAEYLMKHRR